MFRGWWACAALCVLITPAAEATYSPPLTRVRIDTDRFTQTPELVFASDLRDEGAFEASARVIGAQYIAQLEWSSGFGLQLGAAVAHASVDVSVSRGPVADRFDGVDAVFLGGQARAYFMLWSSPTSGRAHAITPFVNLRVAHYSAPDGHLSSTGLGLGVGAMAELVLSEHVSLCPYAWLTPGLYSAYAFEDQGPAGVVRRSSEAGPGFRTPLQFGMDVWFYPFGGDGDDHVSLSVIASLIDTSDNDSRAVSGVLGWTF